MRIVAPALVLIFLALSVAYWFGWLQLGAGHPGPHHTHAILFLVLAILAAVWGRFTAARRV